MALQVTCTEKAKVDSPYQKIKALGGNRRDGTSWRRSLERVINKIEAGDQTYYVNIEGGSPNLAVDTHEGVKYLKITGTNGPAALVALPECQPER